MEASKEQAKWALGQFIVGVIGLAGIAATVLYARHAWKTAQDALADARTNSDGQAAQFRSQLAVAQRHADIAEDTARKQLRAYVHAKEITIQWTNAHPLFLVDIQNSGQTPALGVKIGAYHVFGDTNEIAAINTIAREINISGGGAISAGSIQHSALVVDGFETIRREQIKDGSWLAVLGRVLYTDIFGVSYETEFGFFTSSPALTVMSEFSGTHLSKFREIMRQDRQSGR